MNICSYVKFSMFFFSSFFVAFFFAYEARQPQGESRFRPEPLRKPPREDIKFSDEIQPKDQNIPIEYLNDDQTILEYRCYCW